MSKDYYQLLEVSRSASGDEIKKAYRSLAMKHHPDRNPGDKAAEAKFKEINAAYEVLKDEQKKAAYDRYGHEAFESHGMGAASNRSSQQQQGGFSDIFNDFFGDFMHQQSGGGGSARNSSALQGNDLRYNLSISLEDAFNGRQQQVKFTAKVGCDTCHATGSADGSAPVVCPYCNGAGRVRIQQGFFAMERTCASCNGEGKIIKNPCRSCSGQGRVNKERKIMVNVPAGIEQGSKIRIAGEGEAGIRGAAAGDLYIVVSVNPHAFFTREGNHLHCKIPIPMTLAALGGQIEVPTIEGTKAKLTITPGAQNGDKFKLKGKGMSVMRSSNRGDMYVHAQIETPVNLNKRQKELLEEFAAQTPANNNPQSEGFFKKVKDFWGEVK